MGDLHIAAESDDIEKVIVLLHAGSKVEAEDELGYTPLRLAAAEGHVAVVNALINHRANVNPTFRRFLASFLQYV